MAPFSQVREPPRNPGRFSIDLRTLYLNSKASIQVVGLNLIITLLMAYAGSLLSERPYSLLLLSWGPGSIETMTVAALSLQANVGFVMANHITRMLLIHLIPSIAVWKFRST